MAGKNVNEVSPERFAASTGNTAPLEVFQRITGIGGDEPMDGFGYLEMAILGRALVAYSENPRAYVEARIGEE